MKRTLDRFGSTDAVLRTLSIRQDDVTTLQKTVAQFEEISCRRLSAEDVNFLREELRSMFGIKKKKKKKKNKK